MRLSAVGPDRTVDRSSGPPSKLQPLCLLRGYGRDLWPEATSTFADRMPAMGQKVTFGARDLGPFTSQQRT
jgi:hypothetical protein